MEAAYRDKSAHGHHGKQASAPGGQKVDGSRQQAVMFGGKGVGEEPQLPWRHGSTLLRIRTKRQPEHTGQNAAFLVELITATLPLQPLTIPDKLERGLCEGAPAQPERHQPDGQQQCPLPTGNQASHRPEQQQKEGHQQTLLMAGGVNRHDHPLHGITPGGRGAPDCAPGSSGSWRQMRDRQGHHDPCTI